MSWWNMSMAEVDNVDNRVANIEVVRAPLSPRRGKGEDENSRSVHLAKVGSLSLVGLCAAIFRFKYSWH